MEAAAAFPGNGYVLPRNWATVAQAATRAAAYKGVNGCYLRPAEAVGLGSHGNYVGAPVTGQYQHKI